MYDQILYPTDGSAGAHAALEHAHNLAETYGATVHVLHVINDRHFGYEASGGSEEVRSGLMTSGSDDSQSGMLGGHGDGSLTGMMVDDPEEFRTAMRERAESVVESIAEQFEGVQTVPVVKVGKAHKAILDYAATHDVDIIVMGTHGRTGIDRYLLGSVTEKVVRMSDVPVVTVREAATEDEHRT
ncbi:universal stress protein [Halobacteria archaeon AArc-dxtr1]|nr:universal stress protein [Halobacteria archaeon AArc-dxtr1]